MKEYICESFSKDVLKDGVVIGNSGHRLLYYDYTLGRTRIYRNSCPCATMHLRVLTFKSELGAKKVCDYINECYNDNFIPTKI